MIYCPVREMYVEQDDCCVMCKFYEEKTDSCKREDQKLSNIFWAKKLITNLILIGILLVFPIFAHAQDPKFKVHVIKDSKLAGVNYSINYPVVIDFDRDGDDDILIMSKEGTLYFLENLVIP